MDLMEWLRIWRKRCILTTSVLLAALLCCCIAIVEKPRTYKAESTVVLVPSPKASNMLGQGNPYLSFTNSMGTTADVVALELTSPRTEQGLAARGFSQPYSAVAESTSSQTVASGSVLPGPFIAIAVSGASQELVEHTLHGVTNAIPATLAAMQVGIPRSKRISVSTLYVTPKPTLSISAVVRSLVLIVGLLLILALSTPLVVDAQIRRRAHRRATRRLIQTRHAVRALSHRAGRNRAWPGAGS
jgi:hypothetical protein